MQESPLQSRKGSTSSSSLTTSVLKEAANAASKAARGDSKNSSDVLFQHKTKAIIWGMQTRAVQVIFVVKENFKYGHLSGIMKKKN